jgi:hypothetical protein
LQFSSWLRRTVPPHNDVGRIGRSQTMNCARGAEECCTSRHGAHDQGVSKAEHPTTWRSGGRTRWPWILVTVLVTDSHKGHLKQSSEVIDHDIQKTTIVVVIVVVKTPKPISTAAVHRISTNRSVGLFVLSQTISVQSAQAPRNTHRATVARAAGSASARTRRGTTAARHFIVCSEGGELFGVWYVFEVCVG